MEARMETELEIYERLSRDLKEIEDQVGAFAEEVCAELEKPAGHRTPTRIAEFKSAAAPIHRGVLAFSHKLNHALAAVLRAQAAGNAMPNVQQVIRNLQETQSKTLYWTARFEPVLKAISKQLTSRRIPLYPAELPPENTYSIVLENLAKTLVYLDIFANSEDQDASAAQHGCYSDIRLPPIQFSEHAHAAYRVALAQRQPRPHRFLDVGCGSGVKVVMAQQFFRVSHGLEFDPGYVDAADQLLDALDLEGTDVFQADALSYDGYGKYSIIYFYQPMRDVEKLKQLEIHIAKSVKPGTLLVAPYSAFRTRAADLNCAHVDGCIFVAGSDEEAAWLKSEAEQTGPDVVPEPKHMPWGQIFRPIVVASAANGHSL
jgi:hypothetical protein